MIKGLPQHGQVGAARRQDLLTFWVVSQGVQQMLQRQVRVTP